MNVFNWMIGQFSNSGRALSFYNRGMRKARKHKHEGAIDDYTTAIDMSETQIDVKAMALYNRALMYVEVGDDPKGVVDLETVLAMERALALVNVKTMARLKLAKMEPRLRKGRV